MAEDKIWGPQLSLLEEGSSVKDAVTHWMSLYP